MEERDRVDETMDAWRVALPEAAALPLELAERLGLLAARCEEAAQAALAPHGVTRAEFDVLAALRRTRPPHRLEPAQLARPSAPSGGGDVLPRLIAAGLVEREPGPDGRGSWVRLTPEGAGLAEDLARATTTAYTRLFGGLPPETAGRLAALLRTTLHAVES